MLACPSGLSSRGSCVLQPRVINKAPVTHFQTSIKIYAFFFDDQLHEMSIIKPKESILGASPTFEDHFQCHLHVSIESCKYNNLR